MLPWNKQRNILKSYFRPRKKHKNKELKKPEIKRISVKLDERFSGLRRATTHLTKVEKSKDTRVDRTFQSRTTKHAKEYFENWELGPFIEILQKDSK